MSGVSLFEHTGLKSQFLQPTLCFLSHPEVWLGLGLTTAVPGFNVKHSTRSHGEWDFLCVIQVILSFISPRVLYYLNTILVPSDSLHFPYFLSFCLLWFCQPYSWPFFALQILAAPGLFHAVGAKYEK